MDEVLFNLVWAMGEIERLRARVAELESERETFERVEKKTARRVKGWTVKYDGKYYALYRGFGGKVYSVHVGKTLDLKVAREKIDRKMEELKAKGVIE